MARFAGHRFWNISLILTIYKAFIWRVPEDFTLHTDDEEPTDVGPIGKLTGHSRKVGHVLFNPSAANILATSSGDFTIKIWDVEASSAKLTLKHADIVQSLSWSANGALMVTTSRDKKLRIWDVRQEKPVHEGPGHSGAKSSRATWLGEHDMIATTGFSRMSDRQLGLWDLRKPEEPVNGFDMLDSISGVCMPFWDDSTQCLYLAGKGDGNIRYFEYENGRMEFLSEYKSGDPQRGMAFLPKRGVNMHENEVMRAFKTVNDAYIEPISFIVPRRSEVFQGDIYTPVVGGKPGMSSADYLSGQDGLPPKINMESLYDGGEAKEVPSDYKPTPAPSAPSPVKKAPTIEPEAAKEPMPTMRAPPPSMNEQTSSIKDLASKFIDRDAKEDGEAEADDESDFEEIAKPVDRSTKQPPIATTAPQEAKISEPVVGSSAPMKPPVEEEEQVLPKPAIVPDPIPLTSVSPPVGEKSTSLGQNTGLPDTAAAEPSGTSMPSAAGGDIQGYFAEIKTLLNKTNSTVAAQNEEIMALKQQVEELKARGN
ncbi:Coronin-like protein crn1 [Agyrium rufum]|nr:Coronin-like protein crn1 [Agyrium rufum]